MSALQTVAGKIRDRLPVPVISRLFPPVSPLTALPWQRIDSSWLGNILLLAVHPDEESLGCGGLITQAARQGQGIRVIFASDGEGSHRNSLRYPPQKLAELRRSEAREALRELGIPADCARFLGLPDRTIPGSEKEGFHQAVDAFIQAAQDFKADTVILPWRREPSVDHRAIWDIANQGVADIGLREARRLEYPVWLWDKPSGMPFPGEATTYRVDIAADLQIKRKAIAAYRSQVTDLIDDDPSGFRLTRTMLANFDRPYEIYFEPAARS